MNKRLKTLCERKIDLWNDPQRQEVKDLRSNYGELRFQTIGRSKFNIYFVVYTERVYEDGAEVIQVISAQRANKKEREMYEKRTFSARTVSSKKELCVRKKN